MNVQQVRRDLAAIIDAITPATWRVTIKTFPAFDSTGVVQIGHATTIEPRTYRVHAATLAVVLWVNEEEAGGGAEALYELLSPGEMSIWGLLGDRATVTDPVAADRHGAVVGHELRFGEITVTDVGPRENGPTGYLAADVTVQVRVTDEDDGS